MTDILAKAQELAKTNPYVKQYLDEPAKLDKARYERHLTKSAEVMNRLAKVFHQPPQPFLLTHPLAPTIPLKFPPLSHRLKQESAEDRLKAQLDFIKSKQR